MSDAAVVRLLVFRVGTLACAAVADAVREILPPLEATRIPGAPAEVAGLVNVRGQLVTVVDGRRALAQTGAAPAEDARTVLLELSGGARTVGFTVDEVLDLLAVPEADLERRSALPGLDPRLVRAVGRRGDRAFVVLDTDALLGPILLS